MTRNWNCYCAGDFAPNWKMSCWHRCDCCVQAAILSQAGCCQPFEALSQHSSSETDALKQWMLFVIFVHNQSRDNFSRGWRVTWEQDVRMPQFITSHPAHEVVIVMFWLQDVHNIFPELKWTKMPIDFLNPSKCFTAHLHGSENAQPHGSNVA